MILSSLTLFTLPITIYSQLCSAKLGPTAENVGAGERSIVVMYHSKRMVWTYIVQRYPIIFYCGPAQVTTGQFSCCSSSTSLLLPARNSSCSNDNNNIGPQLLCRPFCLVCSSIRVVKVLSFLRFQKRRWRQSSLLSNPLKFLNFDDWPQLVTYF